MVSVCLQATYTYLSRIYATFFRYFSRPVGCIGKVNSNTNVISGKIATENQLHLLHTMST